MIRPINDDDATGLMTIARESGLFPPDQIGELRSMLEGFEPSEDGAFWLADEDGGNVVGLAYGEPERMTNGTWNLLLIAVRPARQRGGRGSVLLGHVERMLASRGGRVLIVETSGTDGFEAVRGFYRKNDYIEEARIRDFYDAGDDKVVFWKSLQSNH